MSIIRLARCVVAVVACIAAFSAFAQTTAGAGSVIVVPLVVQTVSFTSEITVRNLSDTNTLTLNVSYYDALNTLTPGPQPCAQLAPPLQPNESRTVFLGTQCTLGAGGHFGLLIFEDAAAQKTNLFTVFSRTENPSKIGFSVEGYPIGYFSGQIASSTGLKRVTNAVPAIQSNCFIAALAEAVDYSIKLFDGATNVQIGNTLTGSLLPFQMFRYSDVFNAVGAAPGTNFANVRAEFNDTNLDPAEPAFVGFCTVQENGTTGGDFRIAKSVEAHDLGQARQMCTGTTGTCSPAATLSASPWQLGGSANKDIFGTVIRAPDFVRCDILGPNAANLEIRIRQPGLINTTPVVAGGNDVSTFYFSTGPRNAVNNGTATNWFIEVSARESAPPAAFPVNYGLYCASGNGVSASRRTSSGFADDF